MSRVLIVEDDRDIAESLASLLQEEGYDVDVAGDGIEALEQVERAPPDVIVLDVMLPRLDGVGLADELQKRGKTVPIVMVSAGRRLEEAMRQVGTPFGLRKPFSIDAILRLLSQALAA